jgi:hypothetical protein
MSEDNSRNLVTKLRTLRSEYSALADDIAALLHANDGGTKNMSEGDYTKYRSLARQRDDVADEIRQLEYILFQEDTNKPDMGEDAQ